MKRTVFNFLIPIVLFFGGVFLSLYFNTTSFSVIEYSHDFEFNPENPNFSLNKGDIIVGSFVAKENNLGIISIKLIRGDRPISYNSDYLNFKIRDIKNADWHHESKPNIQKHEKTWILPIGFPIIENSKNKKYEFELESVVNTEGLTLKLADKIPQFVTFYKYNFKQDENNINSLINFLLTKTYLAFTNLNFLFSSTIYFSPFIFYTLVVIINRKIGIKMGFSYLVLALIIIDILIISQISPGLAVLLLGLWFIASTYNKLESSVSYLGLAILFLVLILMVMKKDSAGQNAAAVYVFGFMIIGVVQSILEKRLRKQKRVSCKQFLGRITKK